MDISLSGRAAIVTGGSKGLGYAIAMRFAQSGADVVICSRGREALDKAVTEIKAQAKGRVIGVAGDVAVPADIKRIYDEAVKAFGKVDIVVNNAGTSRNLAFEDLTDEIWREDMDQKVFAAIRMTRAAWKGMKERKWGRVINVLNIGSKAPRAGSAPTTISRAAGAALTKVLSHEGAPHNILVNAMLVGFIESDQHVHARGQGGDRAVRIREPAHQGHSAQAHRQGRGVREPGLLPGVGPGVLHHRHRHQCRRRPFAGDVEATAEFPRRFGTVTHRTYPCHTARIRSPRTTGDLQIDKVVAWSGRLSAALDALRRAIRA